MTDLNKTPTPESEVALLRHDVNVLAETAQALLKQLKTDRRAIIISYIALGIVVILAAVFAYGFSQTTNSLECQNNQLSGRQQTSETFYIKERDKVQGQVDGLNEIKNNPTNRIKSFEGFNHFIDASQKFLTYVDGRIYNLQHTKPKKC